MLDDDTGDGSEAKWRDDTSDLRAAMTELTEPSRANGGGEVAPTASPLAEPEAPSEVRCIAVVPDAIEGVWPKIEPMIRKSVEWSSFGPKMEWTDDIKAKLLAGQYELFICEQGGTILAAIVVALAVHSKCNVVHIHYGAGENLKTWIKPFYDAIIDQARINRCSFIKIEGRAAWAKPLTEFGFKKAYVGFLLEI